jgi:hypothetical protein
MTTDTARTINQAACACWFFQSGITDRMKIENVKILHDATVAQIQTAADVIEAENAAATPQNGGLTRLSFVLSPDAAKAVKAFAMTLPLHA